MTEKVSKVHDEASKRLGPLQEKVVETRRRAEENQVLALDDPERIQMRLDRLLNDPLMVKTFRSKGVLAELRSRPVGNLSLEAHNELERTIGGADYVPVWFLSRGAQIRRTVGMVRARARSGREYSGTGFLIGPGLLMTNHHVLDWTDINEEAIDEIVDHSLVDFDFEEHFDGVARPPATFRLRPDTLLLYNPWHDLDYVVVAVEPRSANGTTRIEDLGYNRLSAEQGKVNKGEPVFVMQHPNSQPKKLVFQNNRLIERLETYLAYEADTDIGSSGSPVFNRQWEVIALHHATQIARDNEGRILARDGSLWQPAMGSARVKYLDLNEGVRVSRLLEDLVKRYDALKAGRAGALKDGERSTTPGLSLLNESLQFREVVSPMVIAAPDPGTAAVAPAATGPRAVSRFPRPE